MASSILASGLPLRRAGRLPRPLRRASTLLAALFLACVVLVALFAPWLTPYHYSRARGRPYQPSSAAHLLGTDEQGRDILCRLFYGARVSLTVAVAVGAVELVFGLTLGMLAGLKGGWLDNAVMRLSDL